MTIYSIAIQPYTVILYIVIGSASENAFYLLKIKKDVPCRLRKISKGVELCNAIFFRNMINLCGFVNNEQCKP